jgi:hypothetical protein
VLIDPEMRRDFIADLHTQWKASTVGDFEMHRVVFEEAHARVETSPDDDRSRSRGECDVGDYPGHREEKEDVEKGDEPEGECAQYEYEPAERECGYAARGDYGVDYAHYGTAFVPLSPGRMEMIAYYVRRFTCM